LLFKLHYLDGCRLFRIILDSDKMKLKNTIHIIAITLIFFSCQREIDINLNESNPKYVIEGNISDQTGPYEVKITKTVNFDDSNNYPPVSEALVIIGEDTGITDTLTEIQLGRYVTNHIIGISGRTYHLTVKIGQETFSAISTMPQLVNFDSLTQENINGNSGRDIRLVVPKYTDPAGIANYYLFWVTKNDSLQHNIFVRNDAGADGRVAVQPLGVRANAGDTISVEMQCINRQNYDYFFGLAEIARQSSATPTNPVSNITGGALGYFNAHTTQTKRIIIQ
jgi:hypothetical protein